MARTVNYSKRAEKIKEMIDDLVKEMGHSPHRMAKKDKIKLIHQIKGGERFSLDVAMGNVIVITQGCDIIRRISFQKKDAELDDFTLQLSKALKMSANKYISVPHRFGKCIDSIPNNSDIKEKIAFYIRQGKIPENIYALIIKQLRFGK